MFDALFTQIYDFISVLLIIVIYIIIFSTLGCVIFYEITPDYYGQNINFRSFLNSCANMLQVGAGEDWDKIMVNFWKDPDNCSNNATIENIINGTQSKCGLGLSMPFFTFFYVTMKLLVLNSFLAIIIDGYSRSKVVNDFIVGKQDIENFLKMRVKYMNVCYK